MVMVLYMAEEKLIKKKSFANYIKGGNFKTQEA